MAAESIRKLGSWLYSPAREKPEALKEKLRSVPHAEHDPAPEPGQEHFGLSPVHGSNDASSHVAALREQRVLFVGNGHGGVHWTQLQRGDRDSASVEPTAKTLQVEVQRSL